MAVAIGVAVAALAAVGIGVLVLVAVAVGALAPKKSDIGGEQAHEALPSSDSPHPFSIVRSSE